MDLPKVVVKKILYATDLSENARYAFAYAVSLADLYKASVTMIHVLPEVSAMLDQSVIGYISEDRWQEIKSEQMDEAKEALIGKKRAHLAIKEALNPIGVAALQLNGKGVNQVVMHYHLHLMPRTADSPELSTTCWDLKEGDMDAIKQTAEKIAAAIK